MPAVDAALQWGLHAARDVAANASSSASNSTGEAPLQVICAWPVSGQYGPGSRFLYYFLVACCVLARKVEWLRNACLAAALFFPAVAAVHCIVLAALHNPQAVDMDVYGTFQLCAIGVLTAPVTVRLSRTYFNNPGRNIIFLWTLVVLAGLLSLTVEFYRINTVACPFDDYQNPLNASNPSAFFNTNASCNILCSTDDGPFSPMRGGSANNIYVIPAPNILTFNTATLLAAACCIPAILSLISMWNKIREINWKNRFGDPDNDSAMDAPIEGTNNATLRQMRGVNEKVRRFLSTAVEAPVFGAAVLAVLIVGERNFFSEPVYYQTEPWASVGQWGTIVGTVFAALGSLYLLLASDLQKVDEEKNPVRYTTEHCNCSHHDHGAERGRPLRSRSPHDYSRPGTPPPRQSVQHFGSDITQSPEMHSDPAFPPLAPASTVDSAMGHSMKRTVTEDTIGRSRYRVAQAINSMGKYLGTASEDQFDDSEFRQGRASEFPEIPGEANRNAELNRYKESYNPIREEDERSRERSRSRAPSVRSGLGIEIPSDSQPPSSPSPRRSTFPARPRNSDEEMPFPPRRRAGTLEVPSAAHLSARRHASGPAAISPIPASPLEPHQILAVEEGQGSPAVVVSPDPESAWEGGFIRSDSLDTPVSPSTPHGDGEASGQETEKRPT